MLSNSTVPSPIERLLGRMNARLPSQTLATVRRKLLAHEFDAFLCHNSEDKRAVKKIGLALIEHGILPWLDEWSLPPGFPWSRFLEQEIGDIKSAIVFVGANAVGPWQRFEVEAFLREFVERGCPVIPALLPGAPRQLQLPRFMGLMSWVDFRQRQSRALDRLIWGICTKKIDNSPALLEAEM